MWLLYWVLLHPARGAEGMVLWVWEAWVPHVSARLCARRRAWQRGLLMRCWCAAVLCAAGALLVRACGAVRHALPSSCILVFFPNRSL